MYKHIYMYIYIYVYMYNIYTYIYIYIDIYVYIYTSVDPIQFLDGVLLVKLPARPGQHVAITILFRILSRFRFKFIQVRAWPGSVREERGGFGRSVWLTDRQRDKQTDRQSDKQTDRQADRQEDKPILQ